jgi:hypothetical protein
MAFSGLRLHATADAERQSRHHIGGVEQAHHIKPGVAYVSDIAMHLCKKHKALQRI